MLRSDLHKHTRVFGSRFIDELKQADQGLLCKSRLVAQNYSDDGSKNINNIATKEPTIQRSTQRLVIIIAAPMNHMTAFTRDLTQAYIQNKSYLERDVKILTLKDVGLEPGTILKVVRPLYGIPDSFFSGT